MKSILFSLALLASASSFATTICTANGENPKIEQQYDQEIFNISNVDTKKGRMVLVKEDGSIIDNFKLEMIQDLGLEAVDGALIYTVSETAGVVALSTSRVDVSNTDNIIKTNATATASKGKIHSMIDHAEKVNFGCYNL